ncbi:MAG: galactitol-1-phosphate 5-dehydrogenase [Bacteroidales bacterium]
MKALVLEEYNKLVYKDVPVPDFGDDEVLIRVKACGICGSDVHGLDGSTGRRIPPLIMGHEASGVIEKTGKNVKKWKSGDRITFDSTVYPLDDWYTIHGMYNLSDNREVLGVSPGTYRRHGAFAEYIVVPQHILYKIPDNVTFEQAAMVEAAAVAMHALNVGEMKAGDMCVVVGAGTIGLFLVKLLNIAGASEVAAFDKNKKSLEMASEAGADCSILSGEANIAELLREKGLSRGADIVFEAVGNNDTVKIAIDSVRKGGKVILIGNTSPVVDFPLQKIVTDEIKVLGSCAIKGEYETILDFISTGKLKVDDQILAVVPLSEGPEWFRKLYHKEAGPGKVILVP